MAWSIAGKTVVVTGGTNGIGLAIAEGLASKGAHLAIVGRNKERGAAALQAVKAAGDAEAALFLADLSAMADIRRLGEALNASLPSIDVLINNAGAIFTERQLSSDGFERTFALNHLAYFLLTDLLLDKIKAGAPSRIINLASDAHRRATLDFDNLQGERRFSAYGNYGMSKLCNILFTRELARRLMGTGVTVNTMHPGVVATGFASDAKGFLPIVLKTIRPLMRSPEKGAQTAIYLATDSSLGGVSGEYFQDCKLKRTSREARNDADAKRLWDISVQLVAPRRAAA